MIKMCLVLVCLSMTWPSFAETKKLGKDVININGVVGPSIIKKANQLLELTAKFLPLKERVVDITISSPGGSVYSGLQFIQAMEIAKTRGYKLRCFVGTLAASMAFQILAHCDERYAYTYSLLLWHPPRVMLFMTAMTPREALSIYRDLKRIETWMSEKLLEELNVRPPEFWKHYHKETLHTGEELENLTRGSFITIIDDVEGVNQLMDTRDDRDQDAVAPESGEIWYEYKPAGVSSGT